MEKKSEDCNLDPKDEFVTENVAEDQTVDMQNEEENANLSENEESWENKYNELNNSYLRLHAEFDNYRKRTIKEKADLIKMGGERIFVDILPVIDDLERALENIDKTDDVKAVKEGVELIYAKFLGFLSKHGVKEVESIGQAFDTERHEAITTIPAENEAAKDTIIDCIQKGYSLDDKVIRFPKVIVAK